MTNEELIEEVKRYYSDNFEYLSSDQPTLSILTNVARHFAQWGADHTPLPEDTVLFNKGVEEGKRLMMKEAVKWLIDDDYNELTDMGRFILGGVGIGYNGYYIPYSDLLKLPKED
jgi:hypothetical protein